MTNQEINGRKRRCIIFVLYWMIFVNKYTSSPKKKDDDEEVKF